MTPKEEQILMMLQDGKSYTNIQTLLQVSPSKIAMVKKAYLTTGSAKNEAGSSTTATTRNTTTGSDIHENGSNNSSEFANNTIINTKTQCKMGTNQYFNDDSDMDYSKRLELEKIKLEQAHEIALRKLDREEEELDLKKRELALREKQLENANARSEKKGKILLAKFKRLAEKCKDGEWSYDNALDAYNTALALQEEIEQYCLENNIESSGLMILTILERIIEEFDQMTEEVLSEGDTDDVAFDDDIPDLMEQAKEIDFDTYE